MSVKSKAMRPSAPSKATLATRLRLATECARLDPREERRLAEEGMPRKLEEWPEYDVTAD